jgi:hypothetical protein
MSQPSTRTKLYKGYRFPPEIISRSVWLYYRFGVSLRDVSELMLARGIEVSHEAIRLWCARRSETGPVGRSETRPPEGGSFYAFLISTLMIGCGNVGISRPVRDFQAAVEIVL